MKTCFAVAFILAAIMATSLAAAPICPSTSNTNTDCGFVITIGLGGTLTGVAVPSANPYDGSDDALIGVVNNSGAVFTGSITLSGSGNGGGLFAFDGDGICTFTSTNSVSLSYCSVAQRNGVDPGDYQGPLEYFC